MARKTNAQHAEEAAAEARRTLTLQERAIKALQLTDPKKAFDSAVRLGLVSRSGSTIPQAGEGYTFRPALDFSKYLAAVNAPQQSSASAGSGSSTVPEQRSSSSTKSYGKALDELKNYFEGVGAGTITPSNEQLNKLIDRAWANLGGQGFVRDERTQAISTVLNEAQKDPKIQAAIANAGGTGLGSIETKQGDALSFAEATKLYGTTTHGIINGNFTDPFGYWATDEGGIFQGLGDTLPGDPGGYPGGGFGGLTALTYRAPDERVIREQVSNHLKGVIGEFENARVDALVRRYMADDRANFDSKDKDINPWQTVKEVVRQSADYKRLHKNRPEDMDESQWVAATIASARQQGVREEDQVKRGQLAATVGDLDASQRSFQVQQGDATIPTFFQNAQRVGSQLGNALR